MNEIDHWHPVLKSEELRKAPMKAVVAGREVVVFRTASGALGALDDRCPHRGMRLSKGTVEGEHVVCPYHGWGWAPSGEGYSPGNPKAKPCAERWDVVERLGAVWVKRAGSAVAFPAFDVNGYTPIGRFRHVAKAPLELVLDNFIEVEHTATTHWLLGHELSRMAEVETKTTIGDASVRVFNVGPQRPMLAPLYPLFGITRDAWFVDDWTTYFSPVYTVYDQYWVDPTTRQQMSDGLRIAVFFNPIGPEETELFTIAFSQAPIWGRKGLNVLLVQLAKRFVDLEVRRDCKMLDDLADKRTQIKGNQLGRFDKPLLAVRSRIERIYRGRAEGRLPVIAAE